MIYTKDSQIVKQMILLFTLGVYKEINDVPNVFNLRKVVQEVLEDLE